MTKWILDVNAERAVRTNFFWLPVVVGALLVTACSSGPPEGSELVFAYPPGPVTLDPARCTTELDKVLCTLVYSGLVTRLPDGAIVPELAVPLERPSDISPEKWDRIAFERKVSSPNGLVYTFRIDPKARFANGREVFVQDVRFSFERLLLPETEAVNDWVVHPILGALDFAAGKRREAQNLTPDPVTMDTILGIEEIDAKTFQLRLTEPCASFLQVLAMPGARILPATETAAAIQSATYPLSLAALGSGPWQIDEGMGPVDSAREILLRAKPKHWSGERIRTEQLLFKIVDDPAQASQMFTSDTLALLNPPLDERRKWLDNPAYRDQIVAASDTTTAILMFNFQKPLFRNQGNRRAVALAIDTNRLADAVGRHLVGPAQGLLPESLLRISDSHSDMSRQFKDIAIASDWPPLSLVSPAGSPFQETAEQIQKVLQESGGSVSIRSLDPSEYDRVLRDGDFDLALVLVRGDSPNPTDMFTSFLLTEAEPGGRNISGYINPDIDRLIDQACMTIDRPKRKDLYRQADRILQLDCAAVFLWHGMDYRIRHPWLSGYRPDAFPCVAVWNGMFRETSEKRYERPDQLRIIQRNVTRTSELSVPKAAILGFIQGLTEFLPISSSGHLKIAERLMGLRGGSQFLFFDCLLHLGTLLAVVLFYRADLLPLLKALSGSPKAVIAYFKAKERLPDRVAYVSYLAVGTLVTVCFALIFKDLLEFLFDSLPAVGFALIMTGLLLLKTKPRMQFGEEVEEKGELSFKRAALIGLAQGAAITPGLSRSGTTIAVGLLFRLPRETAVRFSFLLSVPAIIGATILQALETARWIPLVPAVVGTAVSFFSGLLFLWFLVLIVRSGKLYLFAFYTIPMGLLVFFAL
ncbi:MAG: undecaprenyl-diphosphate phosphatase [bacterium]